MRPPDPVPVLDLLPVQRAIFLDLLAGLTDEEWAAPTPCPGWSVRDIAAHIVADDLGRLSMQRDRFFGTAPRPDESLVTFINRINDEWVRATRRLSPRVVCDLLRSSGEQTYALFASLDMFALGPVVSWAGPDPAPAWLDVAREYTERWHHEQHIREAVGRPGLTEQRFFAPVLATFVHALPQVFRDVAAEQGATVQLDITGDSGGIWTIRREDAAWLLYAGSAPQPSARVALDQGLAWKLFTRGLAPAEAAQEAQSEGDARLAGQIFQTVAIIA
jgi:uncharacterized protein (TIGR03083 family)